MRVESRRITSREEWLRWRREDLTASDVPAAAGFSTRRSPLSVYYDKLGRVGSDPDSNILRRGRWLEPAVIAALGEQHPEWRVRKADMYLRAPDVRLGATPDAVAEIPGYSGWVNLQIKVVARSVFEEDWAGDEAPLEYQVQTLTEGLLLEASHNLIAAFVIGEYSAELEIRHVPRHAAAENRVVEVAHDFWRRVAEEDPPPTDYAQDGDLLRKLYPVSTPGKVIDLSRDNRIVSLLEEHERVTEERKLLKADEDALEAEIKEKLGDHEAGLVPGWSLTFKSSPRKGYSVEPTVVRRLLPRRKTW